MADKAKLLKVAQKHLSKGNLDKAIKTFQQLVEVDPRDQRLILRLADIQARAGRKKEAIENYEKVAAGYMKQDFTPKAIAVYKTILRLDPELLSAYERLAELYKSQGLEAEALSQFENLFQVYERKNDEDRQIEVLKLMADMDPENLGFQVRLGETLAKKGHKKEAAEAFAKAAATLSRRGFHDRASQLFEKITALNPDNTAVRRELCAHYLESGQFNEARAEIEAILAIEPDDPRMVLLLGRILFQLGNKVEGEEKISVSIKLFLEAGELESVMREFLFVAQSHLRNGEVDEAEAFYRQIIANAPEEVRAVKGLVSVAETRKDRVGQINNLLVLGRMMQQNGDGEGAQNAFSKVSELDPLNDEAKAYLAGAGTVEAAADLSPVQADVGEEEEEEILSAELEEIEEVELLEVQEVDLEDASADESMEEIEEEIEVLEIDETDEVILGDDDTLAEFIDEGAGQDQIELVDVLEEDDELPDVVLDDFEDEELVMEISGEDAGEDIGEDIETVELEFEQSAETQPAPVSKDDPVPQPEMTLEELLAEADVYERYGLGEKAAESLEKARVMAPDDQRVLDKIAAFQSGASVAADISSGESATIQEEEAAPVSTDHDPFEEDIEEADFYQSQGLDDEAMRIYQSILDRDPQHERALEALAVIEGKDTLAESVEPDIPVEITPAEPPAAIPDTGLVAQTAAVPVDEPVVDTPVQAPPVEAQIETQFDPGEAREVKSKLIVADAAPEDMDGFLDIADELRSELADEMDSPEQTADADGPVSFEDIFSQFKKGIEETLGDEEYETHYNLGIAYKDMGLYDDAIREFESGTMDPSLAQDSYSLMAMCYVEKKEYESAVKAIEQALEVSTPHSRTGLYYQLGEVRERQKQWAEAVAAYEQVQVSDPAFEGIKDAIERAKSHLSDGPAEAEPETDAEDGGMDDMLADLIKEVEEMAKESSGETQDDPGRSKKDRISYL